MPGWLQRCFGLESERVEAPFGVLHVLFGKAVVIVAEDLANIDSHGLSRGCFCELAKECPFVDQDGTHLDHPAAETFPDPLHRGGQGS